MSSTSIILLAVCAVSAFAVMDYHHSYYQPKYHGYEHKEHYNPISEYYHSYGPKYEDYHKKEPSYTPYYGSSYNHHDDDYSKPEYYGSKYEQPKYEEYHGAHDDHYYGAEHH
ncbi:unnamed protein product [Caenorhabditis angaria]|uniref:Uncharacterized protein n=1 Tax=Caenorhabditis angaria TaxID=860376 RepID=A0A9P1I3N8_9PELO|nr:unnamed protein product [Caenorhabditis angaria]